MTQKQGKQDTRSLKRLEQAWRVVIEALGYDPSNPHLLDSPKRVAKFMLGWHTKETPPPELTTFPAEEYAGIVLVKDIPYYSLCAHHGLPFFGKAAVAYIPNGKVCGLSKFARVVDHFAHRFQVQEELTAQIAGYLREQLSPTGLAVKLDGEHLCMAMRGVERPGCTTVTSEVWGAFKTDEKARSELMSLMGGV